MEAGRVRKTNVWGCKTGTRVERRVEREVSPGAAVGVWDVMVVMARERDR